MNGHSDIGLLLYLDLDGRITSVSHNSINPTFDELTGKLFVELFNSEFTSKALKFLTSIKVEKGSFGWELFLNNQNGYNQYYFSGVRLDSKILILATKVPQNLDKFLHGLMEINNEQVNKIRSFERLVKEEDDNGKSQSIYLFDELSRLNNELVGMQRELSKKNVELIELNKIKNQFLGMAAHDLRNPLANIFSFSQFLIDESNGFTEEQLDFLEGIKSRSEFMLNMVTDLLDVSSIESGEVKLQYKNTELVSFTEEIISYVRSLAEKKQIKINLNYEFDELTANLDPMKIEQVLTNLLTNAIKYSNNNSKIYLSVSVDDNHVIYTVIDEGQGIPEDELSLLFQPFKKTSVNTTGGEDSTGLGLFIAKKIIDAHGGKIWVESKVGQGSKFYFSVPLEH